MTNWISGLFARFGKEVAQTFRSLSNPVYRRYTIGQLVSLTGSQINGVAMAWMTYQLTESASKLGLVVLASYLPVLALSLVGGMIADRFDRRRVLLVTQSTACVISFALAGLAATGWLSFPLILAFGVLSGIVSAIDLPCRQAFVYDVVGSQDVVNAIGINSVVWNSARLIGPAIAAALMVLVGPAWCFAVDGASFLVANLTLAGLATAAGARKSDEPAAPLKAALSALATQKQLRNILALVGFTSFFVFQYSVLLPVFIGKQLQGGAELLGLLTACAAAGSICGNLALANRGRKEMLARMVLYTCAVPALFLLLFAWATTTLQAAVALFFLGGSIALQLGSANSYVQLNAPAQFRGRIMGIYTSVLIGAVPVGSLVVGHLADSIGVALALSVGAAFCLAFAAFYATQQGKSQ